MNMYLSMKLYRSSQMSYGAFIVQYHDLSYVYFGNQCIYMNKYQHLTTEEIQKKLSSNPHTYKKKKIPARSNMAGLKNIKDFLFSNAFRDLLTINEQRSAYSRLNPSRVQEIRERQKAIFSNDLFANHASYWANSPSSNPIY